MKLYRTDTGRQVQLTSVIGKGGEGTVYNVDGESNIAAKIYTDGKSLERRDKVSTMVANGLHKRTSLIAFPIETLLDSAGTFSGFTMRKVSDVKPIHELYAPGSRKIEFPKANFPFLVRTATNLARAIANVHQNGCVIGDINHSGILVSNQATVTLIDSDSFQVRSGSQVYRCRVGVREYTPPELQGVDFGKANREPSHDAFGLAILIFQLLFMGRHPFAGRYAGPEDMPTEKAIKEGRFAYSIIRKTETKMEAPPFAPSLMDLSQELAAAFEQAFPANPSFFSARPSAADWVRHLEKFETELISCRINTGHHYSKNGRDCPWCRLESGMGVALFNHSGNQTTGPAIKNFDLTAAIVAIDKVLGPGPTPDPLQLMPRSPQLKKSSAAREAGKKRNQSRITALVVAAASVCLMSIGVGFALFGLFYAMYAWVSDGGGQEQLEEAKKQAERNWLLAVSAWEVEAGPARFEAKKAEFTKLASEYRSLSDAEKSRLNELQTRLRETQLQQFLEAHLLARATIPGIGDGRKTTLASYGIENAFDVTERRVRSVPGFGDAFTRKLMDWKRSVERKFVFNPSLGVDPNAVKKVKDDIERRRAELQRALARGPVELEQIRTHAIATRNRPSQRMIEAHQAMKQAEFDLK